MRIEDNFRVMFLDSKDLPGDVSIKNEDVNLDDFIQDIFNPDDIYNKAKDCDLVIYQHDDYSIEYLKQTVSSEAEVSNYSNNYNREAIGGSTGYYCSHCGKKDSGVRRICPYARDIKNTEKECYCCNDCHENCRAGI